MNFYSEDPASEIYQDPTTTRGKTKKVYKNLRILAPWKTRNTNRNEENEHIEIGGENEDEEGMSGRFKIDKDFLPTFLFCLFVMCLVVVLLFYGKLTTAGKATNFLSPFICAEKNGA